MTDGDFHGAKLVLTCGDAILALRRDDIPTIRWPGMWDLPGGGREGDETAVACALRELREETGLTLDPARLTEVSRAEGARYFRASICADEAASARLGDEGTELRLMPVAAFIRDPQAVPHLRMMVAEVLGMGAMRLQGYAGSGSAIIEAQLAVYGLTAELLEGDPAEDAAARARIVALNPLLQVPVLEAGDGRVMTESAAITLWLADLTGRDDLVPGPDAPERSAFLRWLIYIVANIYPCFTFADEPTRYLAEPDAAKAFKAAVDERQKLLWSLVEGAAVGPWFLGERFSAIDIYVAVMVHWRPRQDWFDAEAPKLAAIARAAAQRPGIAAVIARHFG